MAVHLCMEGEEAEAAAEMAEFRMSGTGNFRDLQANAVRFWGLANV